VVLPSLPLPQTQHLFPHRPLDLNPPPPPPEEAATRPPPASNPLGPAAQPPYLPAESEYGGPTLYYSCRPLGPFLFDLLGTFPLEPFGILDWQNLDVEDEIYEVDDVREECKVMHALWARWIFLNRWVWRRNVVFTFVVLRDCGGVQEQIDLELPQRRHRFCG
jgi:hypothetical protein